MKLYGVSNSTFDLKRYFVFLTFLLGLIVLLPVSFLYFYSNDLLAYFSPFYAESLMIFKVLMISNIFVVIYGGANTVSIAINDQKAVLKIQFYVSLIQLSLILICSFFRLDLIFVSLVMVLGSIINSFYSLKISGKKMFAKSKEFTGYILFLFLHFFFAITSLVLIDISFDSFFNDSISGSIVGHFLWLAIFCCQLIFIYRYIYRLIKLDELKSLFK
jgi:hypothetical protein